MFKNIFSFDGRIRRTEYWLTTPLVWAIMIPITILAAFSVVLIFFIWIIPIWITLAASVKRSHDLGNSGWMILIPFYNPLFLAFGGSQPFSNQYGENPKGINLNQATSTNIVIHNHIDGESKTTVHSEQIEKKEQEKIFTNIDK